uniref:Uncharacterized protein n=1 Tax=Sander lucioperca TaxID=283035 RepID=A0A8C9ZZH0_SANLU
MKNPPAGMESLTQPSSWRWFRLMDEALSGRLAGTAPVIEPSPQDEDDEDGTALPRLILPDTGAAFPELSVDEKGTHPVINTSQPGLLYATLLPSCTAIKTPSSSTHAAAAARELDEKRAELQGEWRALEREQAEFERELIALERDRELLNRDTAALERDRTLIERDRAVLDRDRAFLDRDRAFLDRDRARDRQRLVSLFQKLVEKL